MEMPTLPLAAWIGTVVHWMQFNLDGVFGAIKAALVMADLALRGLLGAMPPWGLEHAVDDSSGSCQAGRPVRSFSPGSSGSTIATVIPSRCK